MAAEASGAKPIKKPHRFFARWGLCLSGDRAHRKGHQPSRAGEGFLTLQDLMMSEECIRRDAIGIG
jgi:hypothetical protein